jgi:hypothetical protein
MKQFLDVLKEKNIDFVLDGCMVKINGRYVDLRSLTSLPENVQFNNGGDVDLRSLTSFPENVGNRPYLDRFNIKQYNGTVTLYKRVSSLYKTQENTKNETTWTPKTALIHPAWNPSKTECGEGKFHACAKPSWCDVFRSNKTDKYIAVEIAIEDLYEWKNKPSYPQKIGFRAGRVLGEVNRKGEFI